LPSHVEVKLAAPANGARIGSSEPTSTSGSVSCGSISIAPRYGSAFVADVFDGKDAW
jgi:hypothetical protein